jgi:prephenate dehydratase
MNLSASDSVGYLGPQGSFSHEFAWKQFPQANLQPVDASDFVDLIEKVARGELNYAVIPIINSNGSYIEKALKALGKFLGKVTIHGCHSHEIVHNLVVNEEFQNLKEIRTKSEVFAQCKQWLTQWADVKRVSCTSTSAALAEVTRASGAERKWIGAVCNAFAIQFHGGKIRYSAIQDPRNFTLFAVISSDTADCGGSQVLVCLKPLDKERIISIRKAFELGGYKFTHGTLEKTFPEGVPGWLEFSRTPNAVPLNSLLDASGCDFLGSFPLNTSISAFFTQIFDDLLIDEGTQ